MNPFIYGNSTYPDYQKGNLNFAELTDKGWVNYDPGEDMNLSGSGDFKVYAMFAAFPCGMRMTAMPDLTGDGEVEYEDLESDDYDGDSSNCEVPENCATYAASWIKFFIDDCDGEGAAEDAKDLLNAISHLPYAQSA